MKSRASALVFFLAASFLGFCEPQFIVQTGHTGPITALEYHPLLKQLVSAGSDGTVKVWEMDTFIALFTQRIAPRAIMRLAIHPVKPYFAAAYEQNEKYKVSVWDWTLNKELYILTFENKPLFIDFSIRGTYLAVCLEDWKSLFIFDAEKGEQVSSPASGFGIISYVMFSSKETTVMTYQPSGKIIYWELGTGKRLNEIKVPAGLVPLTLSNNKVQLICADHDQIVFIDVLSGKQSSNQELPGMVLTRSDRQSMTIASFRRTPGGKDMIHASIITEKSIKDSFATALFENSMITALAIAGETIFAGNLYGDIFRVTRSGTGKIVKNSLFPASDMTLHKNKIVLSSQNQLVVIKSDYFKTLTSTESLPAEMAVAVFNQPFPGNRAGVSW
jgi:WD40 repeat protein